jgi:hypothetical protein
VKSWLLPGEGERAPAGGQRSDSFVTDLVFAQLNFGEMCQKA